MTPIALVLILLAVALHAPDQQQPTFRSGTELVRIEAHVVARDGTPIERLRPDQFEVFIDGRRRPVTMAEFVRASEDKGTETDAAATTASPFPGGGRVIVIGVDQASFPFVARASATEAARRVVQRAAPEDYVGIVVFPDTAAVSPTRDRQPVLDAIGKIVGMRADLRRPRFNISAAEATALRAREAIRVQEIIARECLRGNSTIVDPTCRDELSHEASAIVEQLEYQATRSIAGTRAFSRRWLRCQDVRP